MRNACASTNSSAPGVSCYTERCEERSARVSEHRTTEQVTPSRAPFEAITRKARTINFRLCLCLSTWKRPVDRISPLRIKSSALHFGLPLTFGFGPPPNTKLDALHRSICHSAKARAARSVYATSESNLFDQIACERRGGEEPMMRCTRALFLRRASARLILFKNESASLESRKSGK